MQEAGHQVGAHYAVVELHVLAEVAVDDELVNKTLDLVLGHGLTETEPPRVVESELVPDTRDVRALVDVNDLQDRHVVQSHLVQGAHELNQGFGVVGHVDVDESIL